MSSNIFGPSANSDVKDSGECGFHYYKIVSDRNIFVNEYQQYHVTDRNYIDVEGSIEVSQNGEILVEAE